MAESTKLQKKSIKKEDSLKVWAEVDDVREPLIDLFDEENSIILIVELSGIELKNIILELCDDILTLNARAAKHAYHQEIILPCPVNLEQRVEHLHNGVLELKIPKLK